MVQITDMVARIADGAMLVDDSGMVRMWNRAAERLLGFRAEEVLGRPCWEVLCGRSSGGSELCSPACDIGKRLAEGSGVRNYDMQTRAKSGRVVWINISSIPVPTRKSGRFLRLHLFRDISRQMKALQLTEDLHCMLSPTGHVGSIPAPVRPTPQASAMLPVGRGVSLLTKREEDVLRLMAAGSTTKEIADALCISNVTVRNHIQHMFEKLGVHSRLQALALAFPPVRPKPSEKGEPTVGLSEMRGCLSHDATHPVSK